MNIYTAINNLIYYAERNLYLDPRDKRYVRNAIFKLLNLHEDGEGEEPNTSIIENLEVPDSIIAPIYKYAEERGLVIGQDLFETELMGIITPLPSVIDVKFALIERKCGIDSALEMLYKIGIKSNYIKLTNVRRNRYWRTETEKCELEITINLSKPEKDNKQIALERSLPQMNYPKCMLCAENVNYSGRVNYPARQTLRYIDIALNGELWHMQYSPYLYYDEHCIIFSDMHKPMTMGRDTFVRLTEFCERFPRYIAGSNACVPIVGGSILSHEHYQGGGHLMPMHFTNTKSEYKSKNYPNATITIQDWFNSDIRVTGAKDEVVALADHIFTTWQDYSDESVGIISFTTEIHNAITPIARRIDGKYSIDLLLRNNRTNEEFADGIFHAHPEFHNIKKEGIGLIEAMGLFILPGRLDRELADIASYLIGETQNQNYLDCNNELYKHRLMIEELLAENAMFVTSEQATMQIRNHVGNICKEILKNTAVFKEDNKGNQAFARFMEHLGFELII